MQPYYEQDGITIYHGDCRDVLPALASGCASAVVTDPPYKLSQQYSASTDADNLVAVSCLWAVAGQMRALTPSGATCALFYDTRILPLALEAMKHGGWKYLRAMTLYRRWGQASLVHGWMSTSDFVLLYANPGAKVSFHDRPRHDVYVKDHAEAQSSGHPAQKPSEAVAHIVANLTPLGGTVLDPYMGGGTMLVAAKDLGRKAIGIEIEERYCEIAAKRLQQSVLPLAG